MYNIVDFQMKSSSDSISTGAAVALSCTLTFLLSVTTTAIITFIITYMFVKKRKIQEKAVQPSVCINPGGVYEPMSLSSRIPTINHMESDPAYCRSELQQNPDCDANQNIMENDPAYEGHNQ